MADGQQGLSMSQRQVGLLIGRCALTGLKDQAVRVSST